MEATFEDGFLINEIGSIATKADVAITELIANAHDAGALEVKIVLPEAYNEYIIVEDNGCGLTHKQFTDRWLMLRYDRRKHQGVFVSKLATNTTTAKRLAFGRNGIGRHAGLCFNNSYEVETWRDGTSNKYTISLDSGTSPIKVDQLPSEEKQGHGTRIKTLLTKNLVSEATLSEIISARFLFNPEFKVYLNDSLVSLSEHPGVIREETINPIGSIQLKLTLIDSSVVAKNTNQHGVAFWIAGRLLGEPSWNIKGKQVIDGRRSFARRYTVIAETDDLLNHIQADWSGFRNDFTGISVISDEIALFVRTCFLELSKKDIEITRRTVLDSNKSEIIELPKLARKEILEFIDQILIESPDIKIELLEVALKAAINLEKSRSGIQLLYKLTNISPEESDSMNALLDEWCVSDAMNILSEIDTRIKIIDAIERLSSDSSVDELHTLHPLIEKARWVFGPEFDTPEYSSNKGLRTTMETVFKTKFTKGQFINSANRPDIVVGENQSISSLGLDEFHDELKLTKKVLLIELKKGGFNIGRSEMNQAVGYVEDIWHAGVGSSQPFIKAFVVGDTIDPKVSKFQEIRTNKENSIGVVQALTYYELVKSAEARLFSLKEKIESRYESINTEDLLSELTGNPTQTTLKLASAS